MDNNNMMSLHISKDMLSPVIEQQVKLMMVEIMGGKDKIIDSIINQVLTQKVDSDGRPSTYSSAKTFFEYLLFNEITKAVKEAISEEIHSHASEIKSALLKSIKSNKGSSKIADALTNGLLDTFSSAWRSSVSINITQPSER